MSRAAIRPVATCKPSTSETVQKRALSRKQRRFALALVTCRSVKAAAAKADISVRTAWVWLGDPDVRSVANQVLDAVLTEATHDAAGLMTDALDTLASIMADEQAPCGSRVSAARAILENGLRYHEQLTLAERVATLERLLAEKEANL